MSWSLLFEQPIPVSGGRHLKTLRDAIKHLNETVPKSEHDISRSSPKLMPRKSGFPQTIPKAWPLSTGFWIERVCRAPA